MWLFDPAHLQAGDVVLERGTGVVSSGIALATNGPYSHALVWVGGTDFVEAVPDGVRVISFARVPIVQPKNWKLLRPSYDLRATANIAALYARNMTFKGYDHLGAGVSMTGGRRSPKSSGLFCSQLVARAYLEAGLDLVAGKSPEQIAPNDLARSSALKDIELPLKAAGSDYPSEFLDRSRAYRNSGPDNQARVERLVFRDGQAAWKRHCASTEITSAPPGNLSELLTALQGLPHPIRQEVAEATRLAMHEHGYFNLADEGLDQIGWRLGGGQDYSSHIPGWINSFRRFAGNAETCRGIGQTSPHQLWAELAEMYESLAKRFAQLIFDAQRREDDDGD